MAADTPDAVQVDLNAYFRPDREHGHSVQSDRGTLKSEPSYLEADIPALFFVQSAGRFSERLPVAESLSLPATSSLGGRRRRRPEPDLPEPGAIIDKYRIEELVGVGGFAAVYRATHLLLRTPVAIKLLRPSVVRRTPALATALCDEARMAARINHPNVVRVNDVTHTPNITYVVIEYVEGGSLSDVLHRERRLSPGRALQIGIDVAEALKAGVAVGIIHRDVKPGNILLTRSGQAKLADLGLARALRPGDATVFEQKAVVGTPGYMAPEQTFDAYNVDFRADVFGLGATLYHAMAGEAPFPLKDKKRAIELTRNAMPLSLSERLPGFPKPVEQLLFQMLAKRPEDRAASWDTVLSEFRSALSGLPI